MHANMHITYIVQAAMLLRTLKGHTDNVSCVAISGNGQCMATGSYDETIKIWDRKSGQLMCTIKDHTGSVFGLCLSKDGSRLVSGSSEHDLNVWEINNRETPMMLLTLKGHTDVVSAALFSPDDKKIASASGDKTIVIWSAQSGEQLLTFRGHQAWVFCVAWSPDGTVIASAGDEGGLIIIWDAATGTVLRKLQRKQDTCGLILCLVFGATSRELYSGSVDSIITGWKFEEDPSNVTIVTHRLRGHTGAVCSISVSPDKRHIASTSNDKTVILWDVATSKQIQVFKGHTDFVLSVAWSPDSQSIVSGGCDKSVRIWGVYKQQVCGMYMLWTLYGMYLECVRM
jgi:WD40 repeat protein